MKRVLLVAATAVGAAAFAGTASAKGPSQAIITGPGLAEPIVLRGDGESTPGTRFWKFVQASGFFPTVFRQSPDPTMRVRPKGKLGPRYDATYVVPGPNNTASKLHQELYPYAKPVPLTHTRASQRLWRTESTHGGWMQTDASLRTTIGLPAKAPTFTSAGLSAGVWAGIAAGAFALLAFGSLLARRRPRGGQA